MLKPAFLPVIFLSAALLYSCRSKTPPNNLSKTKVASPVEVARVTSEDTIETDSFLLNFPDAHTARYTVASDKRSVITANKGLKVTVDPDNLETENGQAVQGKIKVNIVELTNTNDFFRANTATVSNGRLLASGGSYYIGMNAGGETLRIKKGRTLTVEFPRMRQQEMELFYGKRDPAGNMNWNKAGIPLRPAALPEEVEFSDAFYEPGLNVPGFTLDSSGNAKVFKTLNEKVFLYTYHITISNLLDSVNKHEKRLFIDTVNMWPILTQPLKAGQHIDTGFLLATYGPQKQFIIRSVADEARKKANKAAFDSARNIAKQCWQPKTLANQILKYYAPAQVTSLGWINCDRFYQQEDKANAELEIPIAMRASKIKYFLLYPAINALTTGMALSNENGLVVLPDLPRGQAISFIGFVRSKGKLFQCRQAFTPGSKETVKVQFEEISVKELKQIFGTNIKTSA